MSRLSNAHGEKRGDKSHPLNNILQTEDVHIAAFSFIRRTPFSERNLFPRFLALTAAGLFLAALPAVAKPLHKSKLKSVPPQPLQAFIRNSGSTNTTGYVLFLYSDGQWKNSDQEDTDLSDFPKSQMSLVAKLFSDLKAAMPLSALPVRHGMRSASFGTQTTISYKDQETPDLTFASDPRTIALKADVDAITKALHIGNAPRHPVVIDKNGTITDGAKN